MVAKIDFFSRQIKLWGEDVQNSLQNKSIAIIGCGGLGCSSAFALGSSGIGKIYLVDFDTVGIHNIHRQIAFTLNDEGKNKADVLKKILVSKSPFVEIETCVQNFDDFLKRDLKVDLVIDASDNLPTRAQINKYSKQKNIPWIYGSVEEFHGQVCFFEKASFESVFKVNNRVPNGIACPIVMHIASLQANLALRYLAGLSVKKDMLYYLYFGEDGQLNTSKFQLQK